MHARHQGDDGGSGQCSQSHGIKSKRRRMTLFNRFWAPSFGKLPDSRARRFEGITAVGTTMLSPTPNGGNANRAMLPLKHHHTSWNFEQINVNARTCVLLMAFGLAGCSSWGRHSGVPKPAFVPTAARQLRVTTGAAKGQVDLAYTVQASYPAQEIRDGWGRTLREHGYRQLDYDFLDPNRKAGVSGEWVSYLDATSRPSGCVRELIEDWQNDREDVVRYRLRYAGPCETSTSNHTPQSTDTLQVIAGFIPAAAARAGRAFMERVSPKLR
jgi:hypothetical protein